MSRYTNRHIRAEGFGLPEHAKLYPTWWHKLGKNSVLMSTCGMVAKNAPIVVDGDFAASECRFAGYTNVRKVQSFEVDFCGSYI